MGAEAKIELKTPIGIKEINKDNFAESMQNLRDILLPGMPIMIRQYDQHQLSIHSETVLFYSGGNLSDEGIFDIQKGKINFPYLHVDKEKPTSYWVYRQNEKDLDKFKLCIPETWTGTTYNENTFSPRGPSTELTFGGSGTEEVVIGKNLSRQFPDAVYALKFVGDAVPFRLDSFYSQEYQSIIEKEKITDEQKRRLAKRITLGACMNLIKEAAQEIKTDLIGGIVARQVESYIDGTEGFRKDSYPIDGKDYIIQEMPHPCRRVAFVKTENVGGACILPFNRKMKNIVELAFSEDMIRKYYPYGMPEKKKVVK
jgi:hypothetical protein